MQDLTSMIAARIWSRPYGRAVEYLERLAAKAVEAISVDHALSAFALLTNTNATGAIAVTSRFGLRGRGFGRARASRTSVRHLAAAIGLALGETGWRVPFTRTTSVLQPLREAR